MLPETSIYMIRIFTFLIILYLTPLFSNAQFEGGQKLIGGSLSFSTSAGNTTQAAFDNRSVLHNSSTGISINPSIAKFVKPATLCGIGIVYNYSRYFIKEESPDNGNSFKNIQHSAGINTFSQRFISLGKDFFFTIQTSAAALYSYSNQADFVSKATSKITGYSITFALTPGISYKISRRFLFDAFLSNLLFAGYQHSTTTTNYPVPKETKTHNNSVNISTSLSNTNVGNVGLGFRWILKRK